MPSDDRSDADFFDHYQTGVEGDVEFYVDRAAKAGGPVLELGCGTGRILIPVARAGVDVVGLDRAPSMLAAARAKLSGLPPEVRNRIELVEADMRRFSLGRRFALVMIPYRAFLHMLTVDAQRDCLRSVREHLTGDGRLVLNVFDPSLTVIASRLGPAAGALRYDGAFTHPTTGRRVVVWEAFSYDPVAQRIDGQFIFDELDAGGTVITRRCSPLTLRWIYQHEMRHLLELEGFTVEALYGDFRGGAVRHGGEQVWVARRR
jgi:SAM-dependent methyltransferase